MIEWDETSRGFGFGGFRDLYDTKCVIQNSSLATDYAIWFGASPAEHKKFDAGSGKGWEDFELPEHVHCFSRMHLNREQVEELIPILQHFVDTGTLPRIHPLVQLAQQAVGDSTEET